jgi:putative spermidine/putrescine transport system substrate-binding protein
VKRRSFLTGISSLSLGYLLAGCDLEQSNTEGIFQVRLLKNSIPAQLVSNFQKQLAGQTIVKFKTQPQLKDLFILLQQWQGVITPKSPQLSSQEIVNLLTLGDYWLFQAIRQNLIQPIDINGLDNWATLPEQWQNLVKRNDQGEVDPQGKVWGVPYSGGNTLIVYRQPEFKKLGWTPTDWSDLWRPELRGRFSLLDQPREVIGLTLKKLGKSYNTNDLASVPQLKSELVKLNQQAKFYSSDSYLQPLLTGDTWLAVGWSSDILPILSRHKELRAVVPNAGTALWANLWVKPAQAQAHSLSQVWMNYCLQPKIAQQLSVSSENFSPILFQLAPTDLIPSLQKNPLLIPSPAIMAKSEFLHPLPANVLKEYEKLWQAIRVSNIVV